MFYFAGIVYTDETTSVKILYKFDVNSHRLVLVSNDFDNSTISLGYSGTQLDTMTFSEGFVMTIKYNIKDLVDTITLVNQDGGTRVSR